MIDNGSKNPEDKMVEVMEYIAKNLDRVISGIYTCAGLLALIALIMLIRLMIGR